MKPFAGPALEETCRKSCACELAGVIALARFVYTLEFAQTLAALGAVSLVSPFVCFVPV